MRNKYPDSEIYAESCDVSKIEDVDRILAICKEHNTEIDILVNNAGVSLGQAPIKDCKLELWWKDFVSDLSTSITFTVCSNADTYVRAENQRQRPYLVTRAFLKQRTPGTPAAVISTSSIGSYNQPPGMSLYGASKAALNRLTEWVASENKDEGVQAIAFHPDGVGGTEMTSKAPDFSKPMFTETPELAAGTIVYLSTQHAAYLSGRYIDATWDLEELEKLKDRIESEDLLKMKLLGAVGLRA